MREFVLENPAPGNARVLADELRVNAAILSPAIEELAQRTDLHPKCQVTDFLEIVRSHK